MSAVTPIADKGGCGRIVRFVPIADMLIRAVPPLDEFGAKTLELVVGYRARFL